MVRTYIMVLVVFFSLSALAIAQASQQAETVHFDKTAPFTPDLVTRQAHRVETSPTDKIMDILDIKPEMSILDIGGGSGQNAYKFAEKLKGTGKVFTTDINIDIVNYVKEQAQTRDLTNLFPVLVDRNGLDQFYTKNRFDRIFIAYTYFYLEDRINYFKGLKNTLKKGGRLIILDMKIIPKFTLSDISNFEGLIEQLFLEEPDSPFYLHLSEPTKKILHQPATDKENKLLKNVIVDELNRMRDDVNFIKGFLNKDGVTLKKEIPLTAEERHFINSVLKRFQFEDKVLTKEGTLDITNPSVSNRHYFNIKIFNTILITQEFRQYLYHGKPAPYLPGGCGNWQDNSVTAELIKAGYSLKDKYDFIPFRMILVFTPGKNIDQEKKN